MSFRPWEIGSSTVALRGGPRGSRSPRVPRGAAPPRGARHGNHQVWERRYDEINDWERHLVENGFRIVKFLFNISKEEQRERFLARIDEPEKNWKFSATTSTSASTGTTTSGPSPRCCQYQHRVGAVVRHPRRPQWFARIPHRQSSPTPHRIELQFPTVDDDVWAGLQGARQLLEAEGKHHDESVASRVEAGESRTQGDAAHPRQRPGAAVRPHPSGYSSEGPGGNRRPNFPCRSCTGRPRRPSPSTGGGVAVTTRPPTLRAPARHRTNSRRAATPTSPTSADPAAPGSRPCLRHERLRRDRALYGSSGT